MHPTTTELAFMNIPHNIIDDRAMSRSDPTAKLLLWSMSLMTTDTMYASKHSKPMLENRCATTTEFALWRISPTFTDPAF